MEELKDKEIFDPIAYSLKEVEEMRVSVIKYGEIYSQIKDMDVSVPGTDTRWSIGFQSYHTLTGVLLFYNNVSDIFPVREIIDQICMRLGAKVKEISDYAEMQRRSFQLTVPVTICLFFNDAANQCRFVKTGSKQEDVYEFLCPETSTRKENKSAE